jgi:hypothetical protein
MIKQLTGIELSSSKARSGVASLGEILPRLMRSYELQAELMQRRAERATQRDAQPPAPVVAGDVQCVQSTFCWYD